MQKPCSTCHQEVGHAIYCSVFIREQQQQKLDEQSAKIDAVSMGNGDMLAAKIGEDARRQAEKLERELKIAKLALEQKGKKSLVKKEQFFYTPGTPLTSFWQKRLEQIENQMEHADAKVFEALFKESNDIRSILEDGNVSILEHQRLLILHHPDQLESEGVQAKNPFIDPLKIQEAEQKLENLRLASARMDDAEDEVRRNIDMYSAMHTQEAIDTRERTLMDEIDKMTVFKSWIYEEEDKKEARLELIAEVERFATDFYEFGKKCTEFEMKHFEAFKKTGVFVHGPDEQAFIAERIKEKADLLERRSLLMISAKELAISPPPSYIPDESSLTPEEAKLVSANKNTKGMNAVELIVKTFGSKNNISIKHICELFKEGEMRDAGKNILLHFTNPKEEKDSIINEIRNTNQPLVNALIQIFGHPQFEIEYRKYNKPRKDRADFILLQKNHDINGSDARLQWLEYQKRLASLLFMQRMAYQETLQKGKDIQSSLRRIPYFLPFYDVEKEHMQKDVIESMPRTVLDKKRQTNFYIQYEKAMSESTLVTSLQEIIRIEEEKKQAEIDRVQKIEDEKRRILKEEMRKKQAEIDRIDTERNAVALRLQNIEHERIKKIEEKELENIQNIKILRLKQEVAEKFECKPRQIAVGPEDLERHAKKRIKTKAYIGPLYEGIFTALEGIEHVYTSFPEGKLSQYEITMGGQSEKELEESLEEHGCKISDTALKMMRTKEFKTSISKETIKLIRLTVQGLFNDTKVHTTQEIYDKAEELGLELCPSEVGPHLRLFLIDQPMKDDMAIAMEPIGVDGSPLVFRVNRDSTGPWLNNRWTYPTLRWDSHSSFVFRVRK